MLRIEGLVKEYGKFRAVDGLDLHVKAGEIFGLLGPNGAGKTTTMRIVVGLLRPSAGRVQINGHDVVSESMKAKAVTGFIPDRPFIYEKLTAMEFLVYIAGIYGIDEATATKRGDELLELFELTDWKHELIENFSHGMKQRTTMSAALIHDPKLLMVDEPMVGLDPKGAILLKEIFRKLQRQGTTLVLSTHSLGVAEELCERIGIVQHGRLVAVGSMDELRAASGETQQRLEEIFLTLTGQADGMAAVLAAIRGDN